MKIILKITSLLIFFIFIIIALLSYGISTDKFNNKIISQVEQKVPKSKINFKDASYFFRFVFTCRKGKN